jgi:hypothetical protein
MSDTTFGVHSETGVLRQVIVCRPGLAHRRLTPSNCDALLFDDVFWVKQAQKDHDIFTSLMRDRGVEVLDVNELLAQTLDIAEARRWLLDLRITRNDIGLADVVQKRGLSVVNVAHNRYDGRPRNEVDLIFLLDCELVLHLFVDKNYIKPKFVGDDGQNLLVESLVERGHDSQGHASRNYLCWGNLHHVGYLKKRNVLGEL